MARINVEPRNLQGLARFYWSKSNEISNIQRTLDRALSVSGWVGSSRWNVESEWRNEKRQLQRLSGRSEELATFLDRKATDFTNADQQNLNRITSISRTVSSFQPVIHAWNERENQQKIEKWLQFGEGLKDTTDYGLTTSVAVLGGLQLYGLKHLRFTPGLTYSKQLNIVGPNLYKRMAGISPHARHMKYSTVEKRFLDAQAARHSKIDKIAKGAEIAGYALIAANNIHRNWVEYGDKEKARAVTGAVVDTAVDIALSKGGAVIGGAIGTAAGTALGTAIAGPVGAVIGAKVGGMAGNIAGGYVGGWLSEKIKQTDSYEQAVDYIAFGVETAGRYTADFLGGAWNTIRKQAAQVRQTTGMSAITTYIPA
jgi:uncharacterized protein YukE/outer membrane lipoprotein SlyB